MEEVSAAADSLLSGACVLFTLAMFSTGLSDLRRMRLSRSVDSVQFLPFLTTHVNNLSWLSYGALKGDWTLISVNAVGAALQTLFMVTYVYYVPRKAKIIQTQSTKCLSYPLTLATLLASSAWTLYGLRLDDLYITVPNAPGVVTSVVRLWLFGRYPSTQDRAYRPLQA
ncbi:sugar transporter SWEET1 isoform X2 [Tachyglossus aculeatus]|uniref:sugar transporter SWEET1 isoform X2 n=1 Tax=Tachyglossus aculeatus TaxID=9261 RepID=UPI0018F312F5|nr:sugar transporter SWEET1 isoform X2 [Tachyglossus aculeatus]